MKIVATVAEYNPLHTGHLYQMECAKRDLSPDAYAVVLSGNFTQRGDVAVVEKHKRAVAAIKAGADIVLELPFFYAVNCAEKFAEGAMKTLSCFAEPLTISFGSECGDLSKLNALSYKTHNETDEEKARIKAELDCGTQLVKARAKALDNDGDFSPNNVLALEYIHSAQKYGYDCHTVKRDVGYLDTSLAAEYASANAIRNNVFSGNIDKICKFLPNYMLSELNFCISNEALTDSVLYRLNTMKASDIAALPEVIEGLENRIKEAAKKSKSYAELIENVKSKRYTMARIKRILLYALTGLDKATLQKLYDVPPYARILAVRDDRADLLSTLGARSNLIVKIKDTTAVPETVRRAVELENLADAIYSVASKQPAEFNAVFVK